MPDVGPSLSTGLVEGAATPYPEPLNRPIYIAGGGDHMSLEVPGRSCSPQLRTECVGVERPGHLASARTTSGVLFTRRAPRGIRQTLDFSSPIRALSGFPHCPQVASDFSPSVTVRIFSPEGRVWYRCDLVWVGFPEEVAAVRLEQ